MKDLLSKERIDVGNTVQELVEYSHSIFDLKLFTPFSCICESGKVPCYFFVQGTRLVEVDDKSASFQDPTHA